MGLFIVGLILGVLAGAVAISFVSASSKEAECERCPLYRADVRRAEKERQAKHQAEREQFFYDEGKEALPTHEPIRKTHAPVYNKKHNFVSNKTFK